MSDLDFSSVWKVLETPEAADFVADPAANRYLGPFLGQERSVAEVARELGVDLGSVLYRVKQMLGLGLLERGRLEPRAGRPIQFYRSSAAGFFAPLRLTGAASFEELRLHGSRDAQSTLERSLYRAWQRLRSEAEWGIHLYRTLGGAVNRDFVPLEGAGEGSFWDWLGGEEAAPLWDQFLHLNLSRAQAKALQRDLMAVVRRYGPLQDEAEAPYMVRLALTPLED